MKGLVEEDGVTFKESGKEKWKHGGMKRVRLGEKKTRKAKKKAAKVLQVWRERQLIQVKAADEHAIKRWGVRLTQPETDDRSLSIITLGRCSGPWIEGGYDQMLLGNLIVATKFVHDFVHPRHVVAHESVIFHDTKAWWPFPEVHPARGAIPLRANDDTNKFHDARFIEFFENRPYNSVVIILVRGIDGARIDQGTWARLKFRYPNVEIHLAFALEQTHAQRAPANAPPTWFSRAIPHDGKLYCFYELNHLSNQIMGSRHDPRYQWLLDEWQAGMVSRNDLSRAHKRNNLADITLATMNHMALGTHHRNDWPRLP